MTKTASLNNGSFESVILKSTTTPKDGFEIRDLINEFSVYQSLEVPFLTAKAVIVDGVGMMNNILLSGGEQITFTYKTTNPKGEVFMRSINMFVTGIETLEKQGNNSVYVINLGSIHYVTNAHTRISQAYDGKSSDIIKKIFEDKLKLSEQYYDIEETQDNIKVVIPNLKIADTLAWISRRALSLNNTPCFTFEYLDGSMAFKSLEGLYARGPIFNYFRKDTQSTDPLSTYFNINFLQVDKVANSYKNINSGMYAAKVYAFDPLTREVVEHNFDVDEKELQMTTMLNDAIYDTGIKLNGKYLNELPEAKIYNIITTSNGSNNSRPEITSSHEAIGDYHTNSEFKIPFLNSKLLQLENFLITVSVQGNTSVFPGAIISLTIPSSTTQVKNTDYANDKFFSGNYVVLSVRHIFTAQSHMTVMQLGKDSFKVNE